jgi:hypothetical protein
MNVRIPGLLRSYTSGAENVEVGTPATLGDAIADQARAHLRFGSSTNSAVNRISSSSSTAR